MVYQVQPSSSSLPPPLFQEERRIAPSVAERVQLSPRTSLRHLRYQLAAAPQIAPRGTYVGELQEKWRFPSDHLPIGMTVDDLRLASWNCLNSAYIGWVTEKDSQGLGRSLIAEEHVYPPSSKITLREMHVIAMIQQMMEHQTLLSLQECGSDFLDELEKSLPPHIKLLREKEGTPKDQNAILYDTRVLELKEKKSVLGIFSGDPNRAKFMDVLFERKGEKEMLRILNIHLPGDPEGPARYEFASYLAKTEIPNAMTLAMGDMNFNEFEMEEALRNAYPRGSSPYEVLSPYCTNISPYTYISKAIDHFFVKPSLSTKVQTADDLLPGLQATVDLLDPPRAGRK